MFSVVGILLHLRSPYLESHLSLLSQLLYQAKCLLCSNPYWISLPLGNPTYPAPHALPLQAGWGSLLWVPHASFHSTQPLSFMWVSPSRFWAPRGRHYCIPITKKSFSTSRPSVNVVDTVTAPLRYLYCQAWCTICARLRKTFHVLALRILHLGKSRCKLKWLVTLKCHLYKLQELIPKTYLCDHLWRMAFGWQQLLCTEALKRLHHHMQQDSNWLIQGYEHIALLPQDRATLWWCLCSRVP